ncbi:MAG: transposase family protein [Pseudonocardiales bacterium]|nr:transposase family protein [Pseudonocardiales bacterium]
MRAARVWRSVLGVEHTVIEPVDLEADGEGEVLVARVRPTRSRRGRCGLCRRRCAGYDRGEGRRRWRGLDVGTTRLYLEAGVPRVSCAEHGVTTVAAPRQAPWSLFTTDFEDTTAWLAANVALSTLAVLLRVTWRSASAIMVRVVAELAGRTDRLAGLRRIGIDDISSARASRHKDTRPITVRSLFGTSCVWTVRAFWPVGVEPMLPRGRPRSARWRRCWSSAVLLSWSICRPGAAVARYVINDALTDPRTRTKPPSRHSPRPCNAHCSRRACPRCRA